MNAKQNSLKASVFVAALAVGGCASVPAGYTLVTENDHVVWDAFGQPKVRATSDEASANPTSLPFASALPQHG